MASVSSYTTNYSLPLFETGGGGWGSADNGIIEWLDEILGQIDNTVVYENRVLCYEGKIIYYIE